MTEPREPRRNDEPPLEGPVDRERRGPKRGWRERQAEQARLDAERSDGRSHVWAVLRRTFFGRSLDSAVLGLMLLVGLGAAVYILSQQRTAEFPEWVPVLGEERFELEAELETAQSVTPGQGQPVLVAGVEVGLIDSVRLEDGHAVVGMHVQPEYAEVIRADARVLLRPKTSLNDMAIQVEPGAAADPIAEGATIPLERSQPNVNPDEFLARLDADTRAYLQLLLRGGAEGIGGRSRQLSQGLRRFEPFTRHVARLNGEIAKRRDALARAIHDFRRLASELARHDAEVRRFVGASAAALGGFADRQDDIRAALAELPPTLRATRGALDASRELSGELEPALAELQPQAEALAPALRAMRRFFERTADPIGDQIRPFTRRIRPTLSRLAEAADPFADSVREFGRALDPLNTGLNMLAFDPPGRPGFLFYLPWLNHNLNATYTLQDGTGPVRRGLVMLTCSLTNYVDVLRNGEAFLETLAQASGTPRESEVDAVHQCRGRDE